MHASRNCTRCWKELTDAASMEAGIGPVCRNLDNELLARLIPSDLAGAKAAFDAVDLSSVAPETLRTLTEVHSALFADDAANRADWRIEVKRIEWALSFPSNNSARKDLTKVISALGYVGLASLWNGEAATGKATCSFKEGRLVVQGPRNKAARMAFRLIPGRKFHDAGAFAEKASWSFPADQHEAFFKAIITHYPNFTGLTEAIEAAKSANHNAPSADLVGAINSGVEVPSKPVAPKCSMKIEGLFVKVSSPYKPEYITDLKSAFPYTDRRWNSGEKCWEVVAIHKAKVETIVKKHFGDDAFGAVSS